MKVKFIYSGSDYDIAREAVIIRICTKLSEFLLLPENVEVELKQMNPSAYGEMTLDPRFKNRTKINTDLTVREVMYPVVHELIHLNQIHTGRLSMRRDGSYVWDGRTYNVGHPEKMLHKNYMSLPWEVDVAQKQQILLEKLLDSGG